MVAYRVGLKWLRAGRLAGDPGGLTGGVNAGVCNTARVLEVGMTSTQSRMPGCTKHAVDRFVQRYRKHCHFRKDGTAIGVVSRLQLALKLAREGRAKEIPVRTGTFKSFGRRIFDVELPADAWNSEPYTIRIFVDDKLTYVITVAPDEFLSDKHAQVKRNFHRHESEAEQTEQADPVTLPPPVKTGTNLGDLLRATMGK